MERDKIEQVITTARQVMKWENYVTNIALVQSNGTVIHIHTTAIDQIIKPLEPVMFMRLPNYSS